MKKKLSLIAISSLAFLSIGIVIYTLFFCSSCKADSKNQPINQPPNKTVKQEVEKQQKPPEVFVQKEGLLANENQNSGPQVGSPAPAFVLEDLTGNKVSLNDFRGKNVLLVFWLTTCGWCEKERPDLIKFTREQKGKIEVLAIAWETKEVLKKYVKEKQINFTILSDPERETQVDYLTFGTPGHFLINKKSKIAALRPGYATYDDLLTLTETLEKK